LYGISWNPVHLMERLAAIPGVADARRIGVDAMSPLMAQLLPMAVGDAEIVDGGEAMRDARAVKSPAEVDCIRTAVALAEGALARTRPSLQPGVREHQLQGEFDRHLTEYGVTIPALEGIGVVTPREAVPGPRAPLRAVPGDRVIAADDLVVFYAAALYAGYEGDVARTFTVDEPTRTVRALVDRARGTLHAVVAACEPGVPGSALVDAYDRTGEARPPIPIAHGLGLGVEPPVIGTGLGADGVRLTPGNVLAVGAYVWEPGLGGVRLVDTVLVTDDGPEPLTRTAI
jgi:Xaa-Pro aminopeptidase